MKIFAFIRNYGPGDSPVFGPGSLDWYEIPDSSILRSGQPFFVPDFADEFLALPTLACRISRLGKGISERFSHRYIDGMTMGACAVSADMLRALRAAGDPWCRAVAFDKCCMLGKFIDTGEMPDIWTARCDDFELTYHLKELIRMPGDVLAALSRDVTVKEGDILMCGLHPSGLPLKSGTKLTIKHNNGTPILDINIR